MGLRRIGRSFRRAVRRVGRLARGAVDFAKDGIKLATSTVSSLKVGFKGLVGDVLNQLPFGNVVKGFVDQFLDNPMSLLSFAGLGGMGALIGGATNTDLLSQLVGGVAGTHAMQNPQAASNMLNMVAQQHAQIMFPGLFR